MNLVTVLLQRVNKHKHIHMPYKLFRDLRNGKVNVAL